MPPPLRLHAPNLLSENSDAAPSSCFGHSRLALGSQGIEAVHSRDDGGVDGNDGNEGYNTDVNETDGETGPCRPKQKRRRDPQNCVGQ